MKNQNQPQTFDYGCAMLYVKFPMEKLHEKIKKEDVYTQEGDHTFGLEDEPHITLLYGLHENVKPEYVEKIIERHYFTPMAAAKVSLFENSEYDVLKFDIVGGGLEKVNKSLTKLPYTTEHPNYHPHMTVGYIKPGVGEKYTKMFRGIRFTLTPAYAVYSQPDGNKTKIKIKVIDDGKD